MLYGATEAAPMSIAGRSIDSAQRIWARLFEEFFRDQGSPPDHLLRPPDPERLSEAPAWVHGTLQLLDGKDVHSSGAAAVVHPWIRRARRQLLFRVKSFNHGETRLIGNEVVAGLARKLEDDLLELAIRPALLEAEIAERLNGTTKAYHDYIRALSTMAVRRDLIGTYPGLALSLDETCARWLETSSEFLARFVSDLEDLRIRFGLPRDASLRSAKYADSDPHEGGRRVVILQFGEGVRLVYKPRPLRVFALYQAALGWLNTQGFSPEIRVQAVFDRGLWGWVEFVSPKSCDRRSEVQHFYRRLGGQLALLHLLGATDCHHENLIAAADHPQLVDIETLFRPQLTQRTGSNADATAAMKVVDSVLSTGLLPSPCNVNGSISDLSGMGARSFQETPLEAFQVRDDGSGRACVAHDLYRVGRTFNRPRLSGTEVEPLSFAQEIREGFQEAYSLLSRSSDQLVLDGGLLAKFQDAEVRVLLRSTSTYASLLRESRHPTGLYDGGTRDRILGHLWRVTNATLELSGVRESEFQQLRQGDIPFFRASPARREVYADRNSSPVLVAAECGYAAAEARLARMGTKDLSLQLALIGRSLDSLQSASRKPRVPQSHHGSPLDLARAIGNGLLDTAIWSDGEATWLVPRPHENPPCPLLGEGPVQIIPTNLYEGICGVILFLTYLARATGEARFDVLAQAAAQNLWRRLEEGELCDHPGAFDGLAGAAYALSHLGGALHKSSWIDRARILGGRSAHLLGTHPNLDLISGLSGMLLGAVALHEVSQNGDTATYANSLADRLLSGLRGSEANLPYKRGASHGWSGAVWALEATKARCNEVKLDLTDILRFDLSLTETGNWTDPGDELHFGQATWCHGPAGIALCRAAAVKLGINDQSFGARMALDACLEKQAPRDLGLCHGLAGVLDALLMGAEAFPKAGQYRRRVSALQRAFHRSVVGMLQGSWDVRDIGLMTGISGVGLQLLRHFDKGTPSVLLLDPPRVVD